MRDHALIKDGVFQGYIKKISIGDPVLPEGVKILPVEREQEPPYNELVEYLEEKDGYESNNSWVVGWDKTPLPQDALSDALRAKFPDATRLQMFVWLGRKGISIDSVENTLIQILESNNVSQSGENGILESVARFREAPVFPVNHRLVVLLAEYQLNMTEEELQEVWIPEILSI